MASHGVGIGAEETTITVEATIVTKKAICEKRKKTIVIGYNVLVGGRREGQRRKLGKAGGGS